MIWENEHYKFVLTPKYVRTSSVEYENVICNMCDGQREIYIEPENDVDGSWETCNRCRGLGYLRNQIPIPDAPKMDKSFLEALKKFVEEYK